MNLKAFRPSRFTTIWSKVGGHAHDDKKDEIKAIYDQVKEYFRTEVDGADTETMKILLQKLGELVANTLAQASDREGQILYQYQELQSNMLKVMLFILDPAFTSATPIAQFANDFKTQQISRLPDSAEYEYQYRQATRETVRNYHETAANIIDQHLKNHLSVSLESGEITVANESELEIVLQDCFEKTVLTAPLASAVS